MTNQKEYKVFQNMVQSVCPLSLSENGVLTLNVGGTHSSPSRDSTFAHCRQYSYTNGPNFKLFVLNRLVDYTFVVVINKVL